MKWNLGFTGSDEEDVRPAEPDSPDNRALFYQWLRDNVGGEKAEEAIHLARYVNERQRVYYEQSKNDALRAMQQGYTERLKQLQTALEEKTTAVSKIGEHFEQVVADLTEKSRRDPKTKLFNFDWFMERVQSFLELEQRVRWCAIGIVDINSFKWYNDTLGHSTGDKIIERVAVILSDQIRSGDYLVHDLHARFGGDEYSFLLTDLPGSGEALEIANRFKRAVENFDWSSEDVRLARKPVKVDVGVVSLKLGPIAERRGVARKLSAELFQRADDLMYKAKGKSLPNALHEEVSLVDGGFVLL